MRLSSIKLAGFKSFVDPTKVELRSQLTAIVGPNGCGKSNIIDAVRWVMGESSAKQLRGESLTDVIFNGSTHRPPISQASIELHFDNSDGALGGEYASYHDIVVRRQVSRDGQSFYSLNGSRCRRKDITDLFLGTGLGPRSYAIIEQDTISRLIEAKPDDLRIFLEEAAGISKYKERRKETELRLNHTRDNLARLNDIREELAKQIHHLDRQAKAAERFKTLKSEERRLKALLLALRSLTLHTEWQHKQLEVAQAQDQLSASQNQLALLEAQHIAQLDQQHTAQNHLNLVQQRHMEQGTLQARLEQNIQHTQQRQLQIQAELQQLQQQIEQQHLLQQQDSSRLTELEAECSQLEPVLTQQRNACELQRSTLDTAEQTTREQQIAWDQLNHNVTQASQLAQQKQHELQQQEQQHRHLVQQQQLRQQEHSQCELSLTTLQANALDDELEILQTQLHQAEQDLSHNQQLIEQQRGQLTKAREALQHSQQQLTANKAHLTGLETYQNQALQHDNDFSPKELAQFGLVEAQRLIRLLTVEPGYETAVESVLGHWLQALCTTNMAPALNQLTVVQKKRLWLVDLNARAAVALPTETPPGAVVLSTKVQGPEAIVQLLHAVYLSSVEHMAQCTLPSHITLVSPEGVLLRNGLLQIGKASDEGILERQRQIQACATTIEQHEIQCKNHHHFVQQHEQALSATEKARAALQHTWQTLSQKYHQHHSAVQIRRAKHQQTCDRLQHLVQQIEQATQDIQSIDQKHAGLRLEWQEAMDSLAVYNQQRDLAREQREQQQAQLQHNRTQWQHAQQQVHQLSLQHQRLQSEQRALQQQNQRSHDQLQLLQQRHNALQQQSVTTLEPLPGWQMELEQCLSERLQQEQHVNSAKIQVQQLTEGLRHSELQRREWEQQLDQKRSTLESLRLAAEVLQTRWQGVQEQRQTADCLDEPADIEQHCEATLQSQLEELAQKIQRLGLVNLTAIEEFNTQSARKLYLDEQHQDLIEAITILENAIRTIDRETKARFQATFNQVNDNFQRLFPSVFTGGKAYLELTGEDLLDTGVSVFAQPAGKRNSTIHLLSGGEKALTAVALVFAIFEINPAPFCLLDEVDAPLDDTNVSRFCQLVKVMADKTQFIMVTHNKVAMEMAHQLMGVTMQEPGVSRLVAVDMDDALTMVG